MQKCYKRIDIRQEVNKISERCFSKNLIRLYIVHLMNDCYKYQCLINILSHVQ